MSVIVAAGAIAGCGSSNNNAPDGGTASGCTTDNDCASTPTLSACSPLTGGCVACVESENAHGVNPKCPSGSPTCLGLQCVTCDPSANDADTGANPACGSATPVCTDDMQCVQCQMDSNCPAGATCGSDSACHAPALTALCVGSTDVCPDAATAQVGGQVSIAVRLDSVATVDTTVTVTVGAGGSFSSSASQTSSTSVVSAGSDTGSSVTVFLAAGNMTDVTVSAALSGVDKTGTIHLTTAPAALVTFTTSQANVQEGGSATLTVGLDSVAATATAITLGDTNTGTGTLSSGFAVVPAGSTTATATLNAVALQSGSVALTAAYGGVTKNLSVNVFKVKVTALACASTSVVGSTSDTCTVTLDSAPPGTASASVALSGTGGAGTFPAKLTIAAGKTTGTFAFTAGSTPGSETLTATAGGGSANATLTVTAATKILVARLDGFAADGVTPVPLNSAAAKVTIEVHDLTAGDPALSTISVPSTLSATGNSALVMTGNATTEGSLSLSGDGHFVTFGGYATTPGLATASTTSASVNRVIGRIDATGTVDTSTRLSDAGASFSGGNIRSVASPDGSNLYAVGNVDGVVLATLGTTSGASAITTGTPMNLRIANIFDGQLYITSSSTPVQGVASVGTGVPTTTGQLVSILPGFPTVAGAAIDPLGFSVLDTDGDGNVDTIYLAQDPTTPTTGVLTVEKWTLKGTTWTKDAAFLPAIATGTGAIGLMATLENGHERVVATTFDGRLVTFLDDGTTETPAVTVLATAGANSGFRGVALQPK